MFNIFNASKKTVPQTSPITFNIFPSTTKESGQGDGDCGCPEFTVVESGFELNGDSYVIFSDGSKITIKKGNTGSTGATGAKGDTGDIGPAGAAGANGTSITVTSTAIDGDGNSVVVFSDGSSVTIYKGAKGDKGDTGDAGVNGVNGTNGTNGTDGVSISDVTIDSNGDVIVTLSNAVIINAGNIYVANVTTAENGTGGTVVASGDTEIVATTTIAEGSGRTFRLYINSSIHCQVENSTSIEYKIAIDGTTFSHVKAPDLKPGASDPDYSLNFVSDNIVGAGTYIVDAVVTNTGAGSVDVVLGDISVMVVYV
jgi:hypothetical protein